MLHWLIEKRASNTKKRCFEWVHHRFFFLWRKTMKYWYFFQLKFVSRVVNLHVGCTFCTVYIDSIYLIIRSRQSKYIILSIGLRGKTRERRKRFGMKKMRLDVLSNNKYSQTQILWSFSFPFAIYNNFGVEMLKVFYNV